MEAQRAPDSPWIEDGVIQGIIVQNKSRREWIEKKVGIYVMLIAMAGLPGTGKSTIARRLARDLPGIILDKDTIRAAIFPPLEIEYSTRQDDFCMRIMLQVAEYVLRKNPDKHVIFDGRTFVQRYQVTELRRFAAKLGVPFRIIECVCSDETARLRLERDVVEGRHLAANRDYDLYLSLKTRFEPIEEPKFVVDTDDDLERCVSLCLDYVRPFAKKQLADRTAGEGGFNDRL